MRFTPVENLNRRHVGYQVMVPDRFGLPYKATIHNIIHSVTGRVAIVYDNEAHWYEPGARVHLLTEE